MTIPFFAAAAVFAALIWAVAIDAAIWQAALFCLGMFIALQLLFILIVLIYNACLSSDVPIKKINKLCRFLLPHISRIICFWAGADITVRGLEKLPEERFLMVCNHKSMFEAISFYSALKNYDIGYVSKASNLKIPVVGNLAIQTGTLAIDRENNRNAMKTIITAADYIKSGMCSMFIYPEGTRSKTGKLGPFHAGSFKIAQKAKCPVVITAVQGAENVVKKLPLNTIRRTKITLDILECVSAEKVCEMTTAELSDYARGLIATFIGEDEMVNAE